MHHLFKRLARNKLFWLILVLNLVVIFNPVLNDQFISVHDFTGGGRLFALKKALLDGHFPPRWAQDFGYGRGMPLFQFYAPLFFYTAEIFHFIGVTVATSLKLTLLIATISGFSGMYLLGKKILNKPAGLIAATAFTLAPYHAVNFYVRGAFAEYAAISLFPWIMYFSLQLIEHPFSQKNIFKDYKFILKYSGLTVAITALILTHNVTMLTFLPIWGLFVLALIVIYKKYSHFLAFATASLHAIFIAAFFLIPLMVTKSYTRVDDITGGYSAYELHFLYFRQLFTPDWGYGGSVWGIDDDMSFHLGNDIVLFALIAALFIGIAFMHKAKLFTKSTLRQKLKNSLKLLNEHQKYTTFFLSGFFILLSVILTNFKSRLIWDHLPLVKFIQFPWRFLGVTTFFLAIITAYITENSFLKKIWLLPIIVMLIVNYQYFKPKQLIDPIGIMETNSAYIQKQLSYILPDYLPKGIDWEHLTVAHSPVDFISLNGSYQLLTNTTKEISVTTNSTASAALIFNRYTFPNWQTTLDNKQITCQIENYVYHCPVPPGQHQLTIAWSEQGINAISNWISAISFFGLLGITAIALKKK